MMFFHSSTCNNQSTHVSPMQQSINTCVTHAICDMHHTNKRMCVHKVYLNIKACFMHTYTEINTYEVLVHV
jgi:hypothetical protein